MFGCAFLWLFCYALPPGHGACCISKSESHSENETDHCFSENILASLKNTNSVISLLVTKLNSKAKWIYFEYSLFDFILSS